MQSIDDIPGWFHVVDRRLIDAVLTWQESTGVRGDLVELGVYLGKSAVLIGAHRRTDEKFTVCDLFGEPAPDDANASEMRRSYRGLARELFERNYLAFHPQLPVVVAGPSSIISRYVPAGSCRFIHVDASHHYGHVAQDVRSARELLRPDGVVVFDDYRSAHTPGVAAAVWQAVFTCGLRPVAISPHKFYATWGDPEPVREALLGWLRTLPESRWEQQELADGPLIRVRSVDPPWAAASRARVLLLDLVPPLITRALRRMRQRRPANSGVGALVGPRPGRRAVGPQPGRRPEADSGQLSGRP